MPSFLYHLPDDLIMLGFVAGLAGAMALGMVLARKVLRIRLHADRAKELMDAYRSVVSLTAIVLAFSLVQATANLRRVEADVRREASLLVFTSQDLLRIGDAQALEARERLRLYVRAVLDDEWPQLVDRGRSEQVDTLLHDLLGVARAAEAADGQSRSVRGQLVRDLTDLVALRESRITAAALRLPKAFWRAAVALTLVVVVLGSVSPWTIQHLLSVLMLVTSLGVLMALVAVVDTPFSGESAVQPDELQRALEVIGRGF